MVIFKFSRVNKNWYLSSSAIFDIKTGIFMVSFTCIIQISDYNLGYKEK